MNFQSNTNILLSDKINILHINLNTIQVYKIFYSTLKYLKCTFYI